MPTENLRELLIAIAVGWAFLTVVRFVDINEREPVWVLVVMFALGAVASLAGPILGDHSWSSPDRLVGAAVVETTKFLALGAGIAVLVGVSRVRGWSEFSDALDGVIYGIAVGLGYSTGETVIRELVMSGLPFRDLISTPWQTVIGAVAGGLSHGVFGGIIGLGMGLALEARSRAGRIAWIAAGLAGAVTVNGAFRVLAHGNALGGEAGLVRAWLAVLLPMLGLVGLGLYHLVLERRAIRRELEAEVEAGFLDTESLGLLDSFWRRQLRYLGLLVRGRFADCLHLAALHNRQVALALLKRRAARETDPSRLARFAVPLDALRVGIRQAARAVGVVGIGLFFLAAAPEGRAESAELQWRGVDHAVEGATKDIGAYWKRQLGDQYRPPAVVEPYPLVGPCQYEKGNAEYCATNRSIFYDRELLAALFQRPGDFAVFFLLAHEWGHLVQDLRGQLSPFAGLHQIQREVQADCMAGGYARDAAPRILEPGDTTEAITALYQFRDSHDTPWFDRGAHGSAGQRIDAFQEGLEGRPCDGAPFWKSIHLDREAWQDQPTPKQGSLIDNVVCAKGRFRRVSLSVFPHAGDPAITDAVTAKFQSADGVEITMIRFAMVSVDQAVAAMARFAKTAADSGYRETRSDRLMDGANVIGQWKLLSGKTEVALFQNRQAVELEGGPAGAVWEFMNSTKEDCKR